MLDPSKVNLGIEKLGLSESQEKAILEALNHPHGMIMVTGPTGSGKTITLYSSLNLLNTPERNISTIEDPVEINLRGINQVNVNLKADFDFAKALNKRKGDNTQVFDLSVGTTF